MTERPPALASRGPLFSATVGANSHPPVPLTRTFNFPLLALSFRVISHPHIMRHIRPPRLRFAASIAAILLNCACGTAPQRRSDSVLPERFTLGEFKIGMSEPEATSFYPKSITREINPRTRQVAFEPPISTPVGGSVRLAYLPQGTFIDGKLWGAVVSFAVTGPALTSDQVTRLHATLRDSCFEKYGASPSSDEFRDSPSGKTEIINWHLSGYEAQLSLFHTDRGQTGVEVLGMLTAHKSKGSQ